MIKRSSKIIRMVLKLCFILTCFASSVTAELTIVSPQSGAIYHPGDSVTFEVVDAANEGPKIVYLYSRKTQYSELLATPPFKLVYTIPAVYTGRDTLVVNVTYSDLTTVEKEVDINVVLPSAVILTGLSVDPVPILLKKLPEGSDPNDIRISETEYISVGGKYSDGIKRNISAASDGTTYTSSDEKVVTVDSEGNLKAQGIGNATITIRNGKFSATVKVTVGPYEKWN